MAEIRNVDFSRLKDTPECWAELRVLLSVGKFGSFSAAAQTLGQSVNSVARACARIQDLSRETLFVVSPQGVKFTDAGRRALDSCASMEREVNALFNFLSMARSRDIRGSVRVSIPEGMSGAFVGPNISEFIDAHPDVDLEIVNPATFHDDNVVDVTVSFDSNDKMYSYIAIGHLHLIPIASKRYLAKPSTPPIDTPAGHTYVQCSYYTAMPFSRWNHVRDKGKTLLTCESSLSLVTSVISGAGVGLLASYTLVDQRLAALTLDADTYIPIYLGVLKSRESNAAVRAGAQWLTELLMSRYEWFRNRSRQLPFEGAALDLGANMLNVAPEA